MRAFPGGFRDETYVDWERDYKWRAPWQEETSEAGFRRLIANRRFEDAARLASSIESRTNLLFSFEEMALRDAIRSPAGGRALCLTSFTGQTPPRSASQTGSQHSMRYPGVRRVS